MVNKIFAIITDIHSNISALSEAMDIIKSRDNIDQIICLGDCFSLGPEPEKTLKKLIKCMRNKKPHFTVGLKII